MFEYKNPRKWNSKKTKPLIQESRHWNPLIIQNISKVALQLQTF